MVGHYTKFTTRAEDRTRLASLLSQAAAAMGKLAGCKLYEIALDATDSAVTVVNEVWTDESAHDESLQTEAAETLIAQAMPLMVAPSKQIRFGSIVADWLD